MSFTDGKPFLLTEESLSTPWSGYSDGRELRCTACGDWFMIGDTVRWVYANMKDSPVRRGNFFVCIKCDGPNEEVLARMGEQEKEADTRFWWLNDHDRLPSHPQAKKRDHRRRNDY